MKGIKQFKLSVCVRTDLPPHRHDARIMRLYRELRAMVNERSGDRIGAAQKGKPKTAEHRAKLSAAAIGRRGYRHTEDSKARMSAAQKGRRLTPPHRQKISAAMQGRVR